jgi:phage I-like protein
MPKNTSPTHAQRKSSTAVAALSLAIADRTGKTIQLLPAGEFTSVDGRPANMSAAANWVLDANNAHELITAAAARTNPAVIDYEHQTLLKEKNGQPAPAAGWFKQLEYRDGVGLFATDVEWTPAAAQAIADGEYRYISPVIRFDQTSGRVTGLMMAALTNYAGIDGMQAASLAAMSSHFFNEDDQSNQETTMKNLLALLFANLKLDANATEEQAISALKQMTDKTNDAATALTSLSAQVESLKAAQPDPTKFVPIDVVKELQTSLSALNATVIKGEVDKVLDTARGAGKILPAMESHLREMGNKDLAALNAFVATLPAIAALTGTQTNGTAPGQTGSAALTSEELQVAKLLGQTSEEFAKGKAKQAA